MCSLWISPVYVSIIFFNTINFFVFVFQGEKDKENWESSQLKTCTLT